IITVDDNTAPVLAAAPAPVTVECLDLVPLMISLAWTDNCDEGGLVLGIDGPLVGGTCGGTITRTWNVMDICGNPAITRTQIITVDDNTPPTIDCPENISQWCPDVVLMGPPEYSDNCTAYEDILFEYSLDGSAYLVPTFPLYFNDLTPGVHSMAYRTTDECGNSATCFFTIEITYDCVEDVDYVLNNGNPVFCGMVNNTLAATINVPYSTLSWSIAPGSDWVIIGPANGTSVTFNAMADGSATFILAITDENGCTVICEYTVECTPATENCTLTMGGWGQPGGSYCDGLSQHDRLVQLLTPVGVTVGRPGHSYYSTDGEAGALCVEDVLPSGGQAAALNKDYICYENNNNLKKNILLGQSLTLAINIRNSSPGLAGLPLNTSFLIADNYAGCGTVPDAYTFSYMTLSVPQNVVTYLNLHYGGATVGSLMEFANDALGKVYIPSSGKPSLSNISSAATVINEAFDGDCKWAANFGAPVMAPIMPDKPVNEPSVQIGTSNVNLTVAPNPFRDQVEIFFNLQTDTRVTLEIYNMQGVKVSSIFEGEAKAGVVYSYKFAPLNSSEQVFLVVLRTMFGTTTKQIINTH
ncbi:MAG: HYR domain-containing protein, partial [Lentimicrobiaceae bacterium]